MAQPEGPSSSAPKLHDEPAFQQFVHLVLLATIDPVDANHLREVFRSEVHDFDALLAGFLAELNLDSFDDLICNRAELHDFLEIHVTKRDSQYIKLYFNRQGHEKCFGTYKEMGLDFFIKELKHSVQISARYAYLIDDKFAPTIIKGRIEFVNILDMHGVNKPIAIPKVDDLIATRYNNPNLKNLKEFNAEYFKCVKLGNMIRKYCYREIGFDGVNLTLKVDPVWFIDWLTGCGKARQVITDDVDALFEKDVSKTRRTDGFKNGFRTDDSRAVKTNDSKKSNPCRVDDSKTVEGDDSKKSNACRAVQQMSKDSVADDTGRGSAAQIEMLLRDVRYSDDEAPGRVLRSGVDSVIDSTDSESDPEEVMKALERLRSRSAALQLSPKVERLQEVSSVEVVDGGESESATPSR